MIEVPMHTNRAQNGVRLSRRAVHVEAAGDQPVDDVLDLDFRGSFLHHNDHNCPVSFPDKVNLR